MRRVWRLSVDDSLLGCQRIKGTPISEGFGDRQTKGGRAAHVTAIDQTGQCPYPRMRDMLDVTSIDARPYCSNGVTHRWAANGAVPQVVVLPVATAVRARRVNRAGTESDRSAGNGGPVAEPARPRAECGVHNPRVGDERPRGLSTLPLACDNGTRCHRPEVDSLPAPDEDEVVEPGPGNWIPGNPRPGDGGPSVLRL
jgi:hypothetical protein